jgi:hypothetical protein
MRKNYTPIYSLILLITILAGVFFFMMPQHYDEAEAPLFEFSTQRAMKTVKMMSQRPHYVGSKNHEEVIQYLQKSLQNLGLKSSIQEGFACTEMSTLVYSKNILARIKGSNNSKALLLLSHYDSAPHSSSKGASDDASGVATILESLRAFLHNKTPHKNDIIILFTDAEELGLNGAALFVTQHKWSKEVGLVLNLEARGTAGPSYMLMETNNGNARMVEAFSNGNVDFPVSNSLMYNIYKMMPNDTDLTVFREKKGIQGYNFAFIDNHFNYHSAQDNYSNVEKKSLAHQGNYLFPLLNYFSNKDLTDLNSNENKVYFNIPLAFISYPYNWSTLMLLVAFGLFILFTFIGLAKRTMRIEQIIKGFVPLLGSLITVGLITYAGWKLLLNAYPQYQDIIQGFTYNGHYYIYAFISTSVALCFLFYHSKDKKNTEMNQLVAPLFIWLLLNAALLMRFPGASFLLIPVIASTIMLGYFVLSQRTNWILNIILAIPSLFILVPIIAMFPIGLGLKILFGSSILTVLTFTLLLPIFGSFSHKKIWAGCFFVISIIFFILAHKNSMYSSSNLKPNSLVYFFNSDTKKAYWTTYDVNLDEWTKHYLGSNPKSAKVLNSNKIYSKYKSEFSFMSEAPVANLAKPTIEFLRDTIKGNQHLFHIKITPNRKVNRYDIFNNNKSAFNLIKANGVKPIKFKSNIISNSNGKIITYYVVDNVPLELDVSINKKNKLNLVLLESSFDLLTNPELSTTKRKTWMTPTPFVLNDAVIIKETITPSSVLKVNPKQSYFKRKIQKDNFKTIFDTIK